jgi:hypothetical protein
MVENIIKILIFPMVYYKNLHPKHQKQFLKYKKNHHLLVFVNWMVNLCLGSL